MLLPSVADPFAEKHTALVTMCKARPKSPPLLTKPRNAHSPKLFTLTAMRKARAEAKYCSQSMRAPATAFQSLKMSHASHTSHLPMAMRGAAPHATTKPFALTAMCKARAESQVLLTIGASNKLAPILEMNRIDV